MPTFFDPAVQAELRQRLETLSGSARPEWGRMNPPQMLAHCAAALAMVTGDLQVKPVPARIFGWLLKGVVLGERPFRKGVPTAQEFVQADAADFQLEKGRFLAAFHKLAPGPQAILCHKHPFFGKLSDQQWGILVFKHLDHHFRQFGV